MTGPGLSQAEHLSKADLFPIIILILKRKRYQYTVSKHEKRLINLDDNESLFGLPGSHQWISELQMPGQKCTVSVCNIQNFKSDLSIVCICCNFPKEGILIHPLKLILRLKQATHTHKTFHTFQQLLRTNNMYWELFSTIYYTKFVSWPKYYF